jgi:hypothetical protein
LTAVTINAVAAFSVFTDVSLCFYHFCHHCFHKGPTDLFLGFPGKRLTDPILTPQIIQIQHFGSKKSALLAKRGAWSTLETQFWHIALLFFCSARAKIIISTIWRASSW